MTSATTRTTPEQLYRLLADNATDVVTLHDLAGHYLYVSPSVQTLGGYDPEDLLGVACWKLMHPDDIGPVQQAMARAVADGAIVTVEYRWRHAGGDWEWVETTARCVGQEIQCSTRGVSERRAALTRQSVVARLGNLVMQRRPLEEVFEEAVKAVAETLGVHVSIVEDAAGAPAGETSVLIGRPEAPMGALTVGSGTLRDTDLDFLQSIAHMLAGAIGRLRFEEQIRHDALHDALTGLPNRTLLLDRLAHALERSERQNGHVAVFFLDLDNLKVLNDSLGHSAGDELLRAIGPRMRSELRAADTIARFGGDEFAVLCEDIDDAAHAAAIAERLVNAFEDPFIVGGEERFGSVSVGVVVTEPGSGRGPEELLSDADAAMYQAKERGRGRFEMFDAGLRDRITARLRVEADLRRALEGEGRLWVAYQPYYRLPGREVAGVEALVRWDHPERGNVPPADFIPVAEESGLVIPLGARVLRAACEQVARWQQSHPGLRLTVNVSARQMAAPDFVETVQEILAETGLHADLLGLEITERLLLEETPGTALTIELLQALGVRLLLDDFGTGYSSLRYLQRYPLDGLKVDRAFVAGLGEHGDGDGAIVEAIVGMARALGMGVIPEGIETDGQLQRLVAIGCDHAQGFLLSRPLPADELEGLL
jgi:diguanylate cyclase (GGDEF)-like protein/PAS domain S-box-containing protein